MNWNLWGCLYWLFWALSFGVWETYAGVFNKAIPMLTQVVVRYVPWYVTMLLLTWAWFHFAIRYADPAYVLELRTGK